jgi:F-type H+-transporting ATPase subunit epsilon
MRLEITLPTKVLLDEEVSQVAVETADGFYTFKPRHIDFGAALTPGILAYRSPGDETEHYVAVDDGILVKRGRELMISTRGGACSDSLQELQQLVWENFYQQNEREKQAQTALARLESNFIQRFIEVTE